MNLKSCLATLSLFSTLIAFSQKTDDYFIKFEEHSKAIFVNANLTLQDSQLFMSSYGPVPNWWSNYTSVLKVKNQQGKTLPTEKQDSLTWKILNAKSGDRVSLSYQLNLNHEEKKWPGGIDGVAFHRDWGIMTSGRALFIMNGQNKKNINVRISAPAHWKISTSWNKIDDTYQVPNHEKLQESLLFIGQQEEILIERETFTLKFVLGGDQVIAKKEKYTSMAKTLMDYYIDLMGGIPKPIPGNDLDQTIVLINASDQVDGEVIGNHISMFMNPEGGMQSQMMGWFMFAHEFFHLWNGKTLHFQNTKSDWFKEGITNYYTLKALHRVSFVDEEGVKMILNNLFYQRYRNDSGYGTMSPSEAGAPMLKDQHWGLVYGGGLFAGICLDMEIRNNTDNKKSLDNLMRYFYKTHGGTDQSINNEDLIEQLKALTVAEGKTFFEKYIYGSTPPPLKESLSYAGVKVDMSEHLELTHKTSKTSSEKSLWDGFLGKN